MTFSPVGDCLPLHNKHTFPKVVSVLKNKINLLILGPDAGHLHELWTVSSCEEAAGHREELEGKDDPFCDASQGIWPLNQLVFFIIYSVCFPLAKSQILDFSDFQIL